MSCPRGTPGDADLSRNNLTGVPQQLSQGNNNGRLCLQQPVHSEQTANQPNEINSREAGDLTELDGYLTEGRGPVQGRHPGAPGCSPAPGDVRADRHGHTKHRTDPQHLDITD